jgi:putative ABC transport system ATP-binding protein
MVETLFHDPITVDGPPTKKPWPVLILDRIEKVFGAGDTEVRALNSVSLVVERGEFVAIMGASGSGKSTMMNVIGCLDIATTGRFLLDGVDVRTLDDYQLSRIRNRRIGFVFQSFNLIPRTSALANVELPLVYAKVPKAERRSLALDALDLVGLSNRIEHTPSQLSGGQQQRVAIARAIATNPSLILADEPTGALDSTSTQEVMGILDALNADGRTIVVITHEDEVAAHAGRVVRLRDGEIISDTRNAPAKLFAPPPPQPRPPPLFVLGPEPTIVGTGS